MTYSMMCLGRVASSTECRVDLAHTCNLREQSWPFKTTAWILRVCLMCSTWMSICSEKLKYVLSHCVHMQKLFEALFSHWPLHWVFADSSGSLREWWFRVQLDRHVSGMGITPWNCVHLAMYCDWITSHSTFSLSLSLPLLSISLLTLPLSYHSLSPLFSSSPSLSPILSPSPPHSPHPLKAVLWGMFVAFVLSLCEDCSYDILRGRKWPKMVLAGVSGTVLIVSTASS